MTTLRLLPDPNSEPKADDIKNEAAGLLSENDDFYDIEEKWERKKVLRVYTDNSQRTFTTLGTSKNKCVFFDTNGKRTTEEEFKKNYHFYSGELFRVAMNVESGIFLIKPVAPNFGELRNKTARIITKIT